MSELNTLYNLIHNQNTLYISKFRRLLSQGNKEISADAKWLGSLLSQPASINAQQYHNNKSYFKSHGASSDSAANLALLVENMSILSGVSTESIIKEIGVDSISLSDEMFKLLNDLRDPRSKYFAYNKVCHNDTLSRQFNNYNTCNETNS